MTSLPNPTTTATDSSDYVTHIVEDASQLESLGYSDLLQRLGEPSLFLSAAYFSALQQSGSATPETGWHFRCVALSQGGHWVAACPGYIKDHSAGEYVFDQAWARAYAVNGLAYYPKFVGAPAFTPVPGPRLLAVDATSRQALLNAMTQWAQGQGLSSMHLLFCSDQDGAAAAQQGWLRRDNVQFHWNNRKPQPYASFDDFLGELSHDKRKKIKQEQRRVAEQGVQFETKFGNAITEQDWRFFYECYQQTYWEHGRAPYLSPDFFNRVAKALTQHWMMVIAWRDHRPIACSLSGVSHDGQRVYGRYWGALERVNNLHFDTCYYQPIRWCIDQGVDVFEGGAQGEHKMARALLPLPTQSVHWVGHPAFKDAIARFLTAESAAITDYQQDLAARTPFRRPLDSN
jgi:predicted N-acyltransferase